MAKSLVDTMAQDMAERVPSKLELNSIAKLINKQLTLEQEIKLLQAEMDEKKARLNKLSTEDIPNAFTEVGISELRLSDGSKVIIKPFYSASITDETRTEAFTWLRANNFGDIIKHNIIVPLGKGEDKKAEKLKTQLDKLNFQYQDTESVHSQTLKAFVREQVEAIAETPADKEAFPMKLFNVFIGKTTKIEVPKK